jgi:hypothetical protein
MQQFDKSIKATGNIVTRVCTTGLSIIQKSEVHTNQCLPVTEGEEKGAVSIQ